MNKKMLGVLVLPLILCACSTASRSMLLGAAIGGSAGGAIGRANSRNSTGVAVSALIGAGLGVLISSQAYSDKHRREAALSSKSENIEDLAPSLTRPKVRSYMVPDTIEGNKFIKSHRVFILEDPGSWSR